MVRHRHNTTHDTVTYHFLLLATFLLWASLADGWEENDRTGWILAREHKELGDTDDILEDRKAGSLKRFTDITKGRIKRWTPR
jgi:hypothetical protein